MPACNEQFSESGGASPPELLYEFASSPPAQAFVSPPPSPSRKTVGRKSGDCVRTATENKVENNI